MSYDISGTTIRLTRGDTFMAHIDIFNPDGSAYEPAEGDVLRFALKKTYSDAEPLILKEIPTDTQLLVLEPGDTKPLAFGRYVYDIQITLADGRVDTFITKAILKLTEEVE
jgi:hypothetical protein